MEKAVVKEGNCFDKTTNEKTHRLVSIDKLTNQILMDFAGQCQSSNIRVDKDLTNLNANVYPLFIYAAVYQMIENAIQKMPTGGELNVTLISGDRCWELEVADSAPDQQVQIQRADHQELDPALPKIIAAAPGAKLEVAHRAASVHGGHVQSWNCPQGGKAHVLIIPRKPRFPTVS